MILLKAVAVAFAPAVALAIFVAATLVVDVVRTREAAARPRRLGCICRPFVRALRVVATMTQCQAWTSSPANRWPDSLFAGLSETLAGEL